MYTHDLLSATALVLPLFALAQPLVKGALGIFTGSTDIGTTREGSTIYSPSTGAYQVTGGGADIWGTTDDFHFAWVRVSGDVNLTADVRFPASSAERLRNAVLMIRQSPIRGQLTPTSPFMVMATLTFSFAPSRVIRPTTRFQTSMARRDSELSARVIS